ncbi:MAG: 2Fe-2S iron-sulfur cluster binding domain-containing protein [Frankiaceae bacterium]|nr:2Fe-2S iron-sulfur cluster binding domain-containing protein [Frankiaceae bacterium]
MVRLTTSDAQLLELPVPAGATFLQGAKDAGYTLPALCEKGSCGVCRAVVTAGDIEQGEYEPDALPDALRAAGGVLLCCARPAGAAGSVVEIALPYERMRIVDGVAPRRTGTITALETVALDTIRVEVAVDEHPELGSGMQFEAGQFMKVSLPGEEIQRAYSFSNVGNWDGVAEFYVKLRPGGYFSGYLSERAAVGDRLDLEGPTGAFGLAENGFRPRWFVCGGTGLAPLLSMIRRMAQWQDQQAVRLILGVATPAEVFGVDLVEAAELPGGYVADVTVMEPDASWAGEVGTSVDVLAKRLAEAGEAPDVYLCGSPGFFEAATRAALAAGVPAGQIYAERILAN